MEANATQAASQERDAAKEAAQRGNEGVGQRWEQRNMRGVVGNGCVGDFSFFQPGDSAYSACTDCTVQAATLQQTAKHSEQWA